MGDQSEVIRDQIKQTRSPLSEKLEALETQVSETVQSTRAAVGETVETVKETVQDATENFKESVQSVSDAFDLRLQIEHHPWIVLGGSVALGMLAAQLFARTSKSAKISDAKAYQQGVSNLGASSGSVASESGSESWLSEQLGQLKNLAIVSLTNYVRDVAAGGLAKGTRPHPTEGDSNTRDQSGNESKSNSETPSYPRQKNSPETVQA